MGEGHVGRIYGRKVSQGISARLKPAGLAGQLGSRNLVEVSDRKCADRTEAFENFSWNLMVLRHEAETLGIKRSGEIASG